jgi:AmmeMemoRadiSam system protein B/AmmeMemoRadiSam system protein A
MKNMHAAVRILTAGAFSMGIFCGDSSADDSVRKAAVAGQFYPGSAGELRSEVEKHLAGGKALEPAPRIIVSPHAGYVFSGPVAGRGFAAIDRNTKTVIILGPPHRVPVRGIAVPSSAWFETPLGKVEVDREMIKKLMKNPAVYRDDRAHAPEHSLEVQIPFLQVRLASFKIVPLLVHGIDPHKAADMIVPLMDGKTLVVVSTDFSHYMSQGEARKTDDASIASILDGKEDGAIDACGELPVRIAMALAKKAGLVPKLLDKRTSYETAPQYGGSDRVVGYASIVYLPSSAGGKGAPPPARAADEREGLSPEVRDFLLRLARSGLEASVKGEKTPEPDNVPGITKENRGCFVTLTVRGELRGCIGYIEPIKPLCRAVIENAGNAALSDPRFPRVQPKELASIKVEVSVLTKPEPLPFSGPQDLLDKLEPGTDGVILRSGFHSSTYLPQVWEHFGGDKVRFLESLSRKGGMPPDGWKTAEVRRYRAEHFSER